MAEPVADSKTPVMIAFGLVALGVVLALITGFRHGSILGGLVAAGGVIPACYGMWKGIQQETQGTLAMAVVAALVALGVGGILILLRFVSWLV
jgi:hypothetical protein